MHECQRVYSDKLVDDKDSDSFTKIKTDALKKFFDASEKYVLKLIWYWLINIVSIMVKRFTKIYLHKKMKTFHIIMLGLFYFYSLNWYNQLNIYF